MTRFKDSAFMLSPSGYGARSFGFKDENPNIFYNKSRTVHWNDSVIKTIIM